MANFYGHHVAAITVTACSLAVTSWHGRADLSPAGYVAVGLAGYAGGLLPDIDHARSIPNRIAKGISYTSAVLLAVQQVTTGLEAGQAMQPSQVLIVMFGFLIVWLAWWLMDAIFEHRNHTHSLYGAACFSLFVAGIAGLFAGDEVVIYAGITCLVSYIGHLLLDDIYSGGKAVMHGYRAPKRALVLFNRGSDIEFVLVGLFGLTGFILLRIAS